MKKIIYYFGVLGVIFCLQSCIISGKPSISYFNTADARNQSEFVSINVPTFLAKSFLKKQMRKEGESKEVINLVDKVSKVKIMTSANLNPKMISEFNKHLDQEKFEEWASIRNEGDVISIKAKQQKDVIKNLMIVVSSQDSDAVFVDVKGNFSTDDISQLIAATEKAKDKVIKISKKQKS